MSRSVPPGAEKPTDFDSEWEWKRSCVSLVYDLQDKMDPNMTTLAVETDKSRDDTSECHRGIEAVLQIAFELASFSGAPNRNVDNCIDPRIQCGLIDIALKLRNTYLSGTHSPPNGND